MSTHYNHGPQVMLSTRPDKSVGSDEIWTKATGALESALERKGWSYSTDEGGGAFYGPKIDLKIKDAIGRLWQCSTVQCDFNLPERFDLNYVAADGERRRPIMLHRAIFGSLERFFGAPRSRRDRAEIALRRHASYSLPLAMATMPAGVLLESTAGDFPFWLAPTQLRLLPVSDDFRPFCEQARDTPRGTRANGRGATRWEYSQSDERRDGQRDPSARSVRRCSMQRSPRAYAPRSTKAAGRSASRSKLPTRRR